MVSVGQQLEKSLFIVTPKTVNHRTQLASRTLFECDTTGGITNARASPDSSSLFAVANSHVVMLCDALRGSKKSKLRKGDGEPRLLLFSPDSRTLYFTTTLSPSVQAYDIPTAEMLPSQQPHPSPPNVLSVSSDGNILLSASPAPPTIYIQDRRGGGSAPVNFQPTDAETPVSCAAFSILSGPTSHANTSFILGFRDGRMAMYRLLLPASSAERKPSQLERMRTFHLQPVRIGAIEKLHKASMGGVIAAEFVPGYSSRVVSIGQDGRCRLVDFDGGGKLLRTWHVAGPVTCLSIATHGPYQSQGRKDGTVLLGGDATEEHGQVYEASQTLIAVGSASGNVLIFNCLGLPLHEITMDLPILALEWTGAMSAPSLLPKRLSCTSPHPRPTPHTLLPNTESSPIISPAPTPRHPPVLTIPTALPNTSPGPHLPPNTHISAHHPARLCPPRARHQVGISPRRPRIAAETFTSPDLFVPGTSRAPRSLYTHPSPPVSARKHRARTRTSTPVWLACPTEPGCRPALRADSASALGRRLEMDGQGCSKAYGVDETQRMNGEVCGTGIWDEVRRLRGDVEGLEGDVRALRGWVGEGMARG